MSSLYRYTYHFMGIFYVGKYKMPEAMKSDYAVIKKRAAEIGFEKPQLEKPPGMRYIFYFTEKGHHLYEEMYRAFHECYLPDIVLETSEVDELIYDICYTDDFQVAVQDAYETRTFAEWGNDSADQCPPAAIIVDLDVIAASQIGNASGLFATLFDNPASPSKPCAMRTIAGDCSKHRNIMHETCDLLDLLDLYGLPMVLVSPACRTCISYMLSASGLSTRVQTIVGGDEVQRRSPAADTMLEAAWRLRIRPNRCLVIAGSTDMLIAARAAGMPVVIVPDSHLLESNNPLALETLPSLGDVGGYVKRRMAAAEL